ncbi:hypothetical protein LTS18_003571 [Coniosporium uncinatum]|uniref:Uncharacterized protein n=1 Tax=Coniosporium uncinatum TaxID=93489 RepID=A0ACC3D6Z7_9PEZI|nr:hypothetical protein LTS18_003571 [Coniosporium uncinatum]
MQISFRRRILTLAIETSCDDTAVAILEKHAVPVPAGPSATLHFNEKITSNNAAYRGVHPIASLESHQANLATLIQKSLAHLPDAVTSTSQIARRPIEVFQDGKATLKTRPDFISVTRGPGMRSNLAVGLDTAKGLSVAWQVPLLAVHHMQAHALTPRLVHTLNPSANNASTQCSQPDFPFLSLLVSGGHTLLLNSTELTKHEILASTTDIAIGDALDKAARHILPPSLLASCQSTMYGALLESFAFPSGSSDYSYSSISSADSALLPPDQYGKRTSKAYHWSFAPPLSSTHGGKKASSMEFCFSGLVSAVERHTSHRYFLSPSSSSSSLSSSDPSGPGSRSSPGKVDRTPRDPNSMTAFPEEERRLMAGEVQRVAFTHLASRILLALQQRQQQPNALVVAGGVASNHYLRHLLSTTLGGRGHADLQILFPPPALCTDNAAMIAWCGVEMWEAGWRSGLGVRPVRKWLLDDDGEWVGQRRGEEVGMGEGEVGGEGEAEGKGEGGGVLAVGGWYNVGAGDVIE